jgi:hypothetical protein
MDETNSRPSVETGPLLRDLFVRVGEADDCTFHKHTIETAEG